MRALLLEDDMQLGRALASSLRTQGIRVEWVRLVADALAFIDGTEFAVLIVDVKLPDGNGIDLINALRARHLSTPMLIITASEALDDRIRGLNSGADDVMVKPFAVDERVARVHAVVRRSAGRFMQRWAVRDIEIDVGLRRVSQAGRPVDLTSTEFDLLFELVRHANQVLPREQLEQAVLKFTELPGSKAIDVHIHNLRRKLGAESIRTIRGVGFLIEEVKA
jgi:two-component system response regulator QseB